MCVDAEAAATAVAAGAGSTVVGLQVGGSWRRGHLQPALLTGGPPNLLQRKRIPGPKGRHEAK
jgi:hypothetical protein